MTAFSDLTPEDRGLVNGGEHHPLLRFISSIAPFTFLTFYDINRFTRCLKFAVGLLWQRH